MKRTVLSLCAALVLVLSLAACSRNKAPDVTPTPTLSPSPSPSPSPTATPMVTPSATPDVTLSPDSNDMMDDSDYSADDDGTVNPSEGDNQNGATRNGTNKAGNAIGDIANGIGNAAGDIANGVGNALR